MKQETADDVVKPEWAPKTETGEGDNWFTSFKSEQDSIAPELEPKTDHGPVAGVPPDPPSVRSRRLPLAVLSVGVCLAATWFTWQAWTATPSASALTKPAAVEGTAVFSSLPEGASIAIDGTARGVTPLRVSLPAGTYSVQITSGSVSRTLPVTIEPGGVVSQYIELAGAQPTLGGRVEIGSEPPGAQVVLDGVSRGTTPLALADVPPGQHRVSVSAGDNTVNRVVNVTRGATSTLVVSMSPTATGGSGGWLAIQAPVDMEILEDGRILGTTRMDRLMLPVGSHRIELSNPALEFSVARTVQIAAGRTANVAVPLPAGRLSVNAVPWADVTLDGAAVGTTPLGELSVPIGTHELVFRHPQLGERRQTVTVKAQTPTRIGIDLRK